MNVYTSTLWIEIEIIFSLFINALRPWMAFIWPWHCICRWVNRLHLSHAHTRTHTHAYAYSQYKMRRVRATRARCCEQEGSVL